WRGKQEVHWARPGSPRQLEFPGLPYRDGVRVLETLGDFLSGDETAHGVAGLRTATKPILDSLGLQVYFRRLLQRIVSAHNFHKAAIAGEPLIDYHDTVSRNLLLSITSQTDREHSVIPPLPGYCIPEWAFCEIQ